MLDSTPKAVGPDPLTVTGGVDRRVSTSPLVAPRPTEVEGDLPGYRRIPTHQLLHDACTKDRYWVLHFLASYDLDEYRDTIQSLQWYADKYDCNRSVIRRLLDTRRREFDSISSDSDATAERQSSDSRATVAFSTDADLARKRDGVATVRRQQSDSGATPPKRQSIETETEKSKRSPSRDRKAGMISLPADFPTYEQAERILDWFASAVELRGSADAFHSKLKALLEDFRLKYESSERTYKGPAGWESHFKRCVRNGWVSAGPGPVNGSSVGLDAALTPQTRRTVEAVRQVQLGMRDRQEGF